MNAPAHPPLPKRAYTMKQTTEVTGFGPTRIYDLIAKGRLRTFKVGRRRMTTAEAIDECLRTLEGEARGDL